MSTPADARWAEARTAGRSVVDLIVAESKDCLMLKNECEMVKGIRTRKMNVC